MAEDEVSGLAAEITVGLAGLQSGLERAEAYLRAFDEKYGHITVQIAANFVEPTQQQVQAVARGTKGKLDAVGAVTVPATFGAPTREQTERFRAGLERSLGPISVGATLRAPTGARGAGGEAIGGQFITPERATALGITPVPVAPAARAAISTTTEAAPLLAAALKRNDGLLAAKVSAAAAPEPRVISPAPVPVVIAPPITPERAQVSRPPVVSAPQVTTEAAIQRAPITAPVASAPPFNEGEARAAAQVRANAAGRAVQYPTPTGIGRVFPTSTGGPIGAEGTESVGGFALPPGARGIRGAEEAGAAPGAGEVLRAQKARIDELESRLETRAPAEQVEPTLTSAQVEQRRAAGQASYQQAVAERRIGVGGRILPRPAPTVEDRTRQLDEKVRIMEQQFRERTIRRPPTAETQLAAEAEYRPPQEYNPERQEQELRAVTGEFGAAAQATAEANLPPTPSLRRTRPPTTAIPRIRRIGVEERAAIAGATPELEEGVAQRQVREEQLIAARQFATVRAPGTFLAGAISVGAGGAQARELAAQATRASSEAKKAEEALFSARDRERQIEKSYYETTSPTIRKQIRTELNEQREIVERLGNEYQQAGNKADVLATAALKAANPLRNLAAGFVGGIAGSLAYGVGISAITSAFGLLEKAVGPAIERITGFAALTNTTVGNLSEQARAQHGLTESVVAAQFAQSGLSESVAQTIRPVLEQRVSTEAGNKALQDQIDLIHVYQQLQEQQQRVAGGGAVGPFQTAGANPGLTTGTGGLLNTPFGQTPGLVEQLAQLIPGGTGGQRAQNNAIAGALGGAGLGAALGAPFFGIGALPGALAGAVGGGIGGAVTGGVLGGGITGNDVKNLDLLKLSITNVNEAAERGAKSTGSLAKAITGATDAQVNGTADLLKSVGATDDQIKLLKEARVAFVQPTTGGPIAQAPVTTAVQLQQFQQAVSRGAATPALAEVLADLRERTIPARQFQVAAQGAAARDLLTAQIGVQRAAQPFLPAGVTVPGGLSAVSSQITALIGNSIKGIDTIQAGRIDAGRIAIQNITSGLAPAAQAAAGADFGRIQQLGAQSAAIQTGVTREQVGLQVAQYDEQIRQQRLSLTDLAQITGRIGQTAGDNLGIYERQNIVLGRQSAELTLQSQQLQLQSQELQIQLAQRQINFQVAVAGFTAAGTTPEERAARIEEAKAEAEYAQKQLDIQKQQQAIGTKQVAIAGQVLPISFRIEDIQHNREYVTARNALNLLGRARQVAIDTAGAQEALQRIQAEIDATTADLNTYLQAGEQLIQGRISDQAAILQQFVSSTRTLEQVSSEFYSATSSAYSTAFNKYLQTVTSGIISATSAISGITVGSNPAPGFFPATGYLGEVTGETHFVAGEAGTEAVAVLAHPRDVMVHPRGAMEMTVGSVHGQNVGIVKNPPKFADGFVGNTDQIARMATGFMGTSKDIARLAGGFVGSVGHGPMLGATGSSLKSDSPGARTTLVESTHVVERNVDHFADGAVFLTQPRLNIGAISVLGGIVNMAPQPRSTPPMNFAQGFMGTVGGRTEMTVGEAGRETIAVIRNPRQVQGSDDARGVSGGGGISVQITFAAPITVGSRDDLEEMTTQMSEKVKEVLVRVMTPPVARKVEESLSRRTSLLGFRTVSN
jgi:hypothetical protein